MQTQTPSGRLTMSQQVSEAAGILAIGVIRTRGRETARIRKNSSFSEKGLDLSVDSSVHSTNPSARGEKL